MIGFLDIGKILVPQKCVLIVYEHLRKAGSNGVEGIALWAGKSSNTVFTVETAVIPKQKALRYEDGLLYTVEGDELHRLNKWLYLNKLSLIAQVHSHPREAYHSSTDDEFPIISTVGGISIVIPNFGFGEISKRSWAVYRLQQQSGWVEQNAEEVNSLIEIID